MERITMACIVTVKQPNPQITQDVAQQHNPTNMYQSLMIMPFGYCSYLKKTSGLVGKLKDDYLYPQHLFSDGGCGQLVMEFDQPLPENWEQIFLEVANEPFEDPELNAMLPNEVFDYQQAFTVEKQFKTYIENVRRYKQSNIDDNYLNSYIIPELVPYVDGEQSPCRVSQCNDSIQNQTIYRNTLWQILAPRAGSIQ